LSSKVGVVVTILDESIDDSSFNLNVFFNGSCNTIARKLRALCTFLSNTAWVLVCISSSFFAVVMLWAGLLSVRVIVTVSTGLAHVTSWHGRGCLVGSPLALEVDWGSRWASLSSYTRASRFRGGTGWTVVPIATNGSWLFKAVSGTIVSLSTFEAVSTCSGSEHRLVGTSQAVSLLGGSGGLVAILSLWAKTEEKVIVIVLHVVGVRSGGWVERVRVAIVTSRAIQATIKAGSSFCWAVISGVTSCASASINSSWDIIVTTDQAKRLVHSTCWTIVTNSTLLDVI
jgi:hypothetical protein